jgi:hypothetical protein
VNPFPTNREFPANLVDKLFFELMTRSQTDAAITSEGFGSDATIQRWINILVAIDRKLAQIAITEASAQGDHHRKIAEALEELARGEADASRGDYDMDADGFLPLSHRSLCNIVINDLTARARISTTAYNGLRVRRKPSWISCMTP